MVLLAVCGRVIDHDHTLATLVNTFVHKHCTELILPRDLLGDSHVTSRYKNGLCFTESGIRTVIQYGVWVRNHSRRPLSVNDPIYFARSGGRMQ